MGEAGGVFTVWGKGNWITVLFGTLLYSISLAIHAHASASANA